MLRPGLACERQEVSGRTMSVCVHHGTMCHTWYHLATRCCKIKAARQAAQCVPAPRNPARDAEIDVLEAAAGHLLGGA